MKEFKVTSSPNALQLAQNTLENLLIEALDSVKEDNEKQEVLFLSSGGSQLKLLENPSLKLVSKLSKKLTISILDERWSREAVSNNFMQLQQTKFYNIALKKGCKFIPTIPEEKESLEEFGKRINNQFVHWFNKQYITQKTKCMKSKSACTIGQKQRAESSLENTKKIVSTKPYYCIVTLGMGKDGHTAGIMPIKDEHKFTHLFGFYNSDTTDEKQYATKSTSSRHRQYPEVSTKFNSANEQTAKYIVSYDATGLNDQPYRITVNLDFLKHKVDKAVAYISGENKKEKLEHLIKHKQIQDQQQQKDTQSSQERGKYKGQSKHFIQQDLGVPERLKRLNGRGLSKQYKINLQPSLIFLDMEYIHIFSDLKC